MKRFLTVFIIITAFIPVPGSNKTLDNYGVKQRTIGPTILSKGVDKISLVQEISYRKVATLVPYVKKASKHFNIPENVLLAVLYEEATHRKPIDVNTFGVAQLGLGELTAQGLPAKVNLLEDDEVSVWLLARQLRRLQDQTGSLADAIILHNGYYDFYPAVKKRAKDSKILMLLSEQNISYTLVV